jgi:hypothetical protein
MKHILPSLWGPPADASVRATLAGWIQLRTAIPATALRRGVLALLVGLAALIGSIDAEPNAPRVAPVVATKSGRSDAAQQVVREAAARLTRYTSISCRMRCRGEIFGKRILGNGEYRQLAGASNRLRWDTKLQVGDAIVSVQQIADGKYLWINRRKPPATTLSRVELARVVTAERAAQTKSPASGQALGQMGLAAMGGLPKLVSSLDRGFGFSRLNKTQLGDTPVFTVRGDWTPAVLAMLAPDQQEAAKAGRPIDWNQVPEQVPDHVVLALGCTDYFPYRVEYRRTIGDHYKVLLVIELYDVQCNVRLEQTLFSYQPGTTPIIDITDEFIAGLLPPAG